MPYSNRVRVIGEHDRDDLGCRAGGLDLGRRIREDDVNVEADQLGRQLRQLLRRRSPPELERHVLALDVPKIPQAASECPCSALVFDGRTLVETSNAVDFRWLLRMHLRRERRGEGTGQRGQQEAAAIHHSIT